MLIYIFLRIAKNVLCLLLKGSPRGMKRGEKEGHVERAGILPDRPEIHDKLCRMKHSRVMGPIITSKGSRNCAAEINALQVGLTSAALTSDQHTVHATC